ncbi:MAG: hypothetical protein HXX11_20630 [Desulfuromonadales bacterium]|nr:hypothetical protein [Desulfuromonadales bacterium]
MAIEWHEAPLKFKIAWFIWLIGTPVISVILWKMQIPNLDYYLFTLVIVSWTAAILYKRRKRTLAKTMLEESGHE